MYNLVGNHKMLGWLFRTRDCWRMNEVVDSLGPRFIHYYLHAILNYVNRLHAFLA